MSRYLLIALAGCVAASLAVGQTLWGPKGQPAVYKSPMKPLTKLKDVLADHAGMNDWHYVVVDDAQLHSEYVGMRPGYAAGRRLHPDTREWWVILDGQVEFDIETVGKVTASKGGMVQVPMQTMFSYKVVGDKPALMFDTNITGSHTVYERDTPPGPVPGIDWYPVKFAGRKAGQYLHNNKPLATFDETAEGVDSGRLKGTIRIVQDDRGAANFIYGYNSKLPPLDPNNKGHYHPEGAEYWLIMKGQIRYPIEKVGVVVANEGDVVYVPPFTWHAPRWWGDGASCRLAMNGFPDIAHLTDGAMGGH